MYNDDTALFCNKIIHVELLDLEKLGNQVITRKMFLTV